MNAFGERYARPSGPAGSGSALVTASAGAVSLAPAGTLGLGRSFVLRDVVTTAFLRWRLILLCLLLPLLVGILAGALVPERFTAEALMVVSVSRESAGNVDIGGYGPSILSVDVPKAVQSEIEILTSDTVATDALQKMGPDQLYPELARGRLFGLLPPLPPAQRLQRASELLRRDLRADVLPNTNTMRVQFEYRDRAKAVEALHDVVDAYMTRRRAIFTDTSVGYLTAEVARNETELQSIERRMAAIKGDFHILDIDQSVHLAAARLDGIIQREDKVREEREAALAQIASARARLPGQPSKVFASSEVTNQSPNDDSRNTLLRLQQERAHVASQYAPGYPALVELDNKIAAAQSAIRQNQATNFTTTREQRNPTVELLSTKLTQMQVEADALSKQLDEIGRQRDQAQSYDNALLGAETELRSLGRRRDALDAVYRQFATREASAKLNDEAAQSRGAAVHVVQDPTAPVSGRSMALSFSLAGLVVGGLCAAAAAMLGTGLRRIFVSAAEVERGLQMPVLASFPRAGRPFDIAAASPAVANLSALLLDMGPNGPLGHHVQVVQMVATDAEDGRDLLARVLAVELAREHNCKVLLCDLSADGRAHLSDLGVNHTQSGAADGGITAYGTIIPNLWITYGAQQSILADPHALQSHVERVLAQLRQDFDVVVLVAPPSLDSYAERRLTALVDANVIVVRAERTDGPHALGLRETILSSGGNLLGAVFTGQRRVVPPAVQRALA